MSKCRECKYAKVIASYDDKGIKPLRVCTANAEVDIVIEHLIQYEKFQACQDFEEREEEDEAKTLMLEQNEAMKLLIQIGLSKEELDNE